MQITLSNPRMEAAERLEESAIAAWENTADAINSTLRVILWLLIYVLLSGADSLKLLEQKTQKVSA